MLSRNATLAASCLAVALLAACTATNPKYCEKPGDCQAGLTCDLPHNRCVSPDGSVGQPDGPIVVVDGEANADAPIGGEAGGLDGARADGGGSDRPGPDVRGIDAAGTCSVTADCTDPTKAFCVGNVCVGCQAAGTGACSGSAAVCDAASGKCVACTADSHCPMAAAPICDKAKNACATCSADLQCQAKDPALPSCRADGQCVQCTAATAATACAGGTPACDTATNTCVECTSAATCSGAKPICAASEKCQACAADAECAALKDPARSTCTPTGACVQCTATNAAKCTGATSVCNTAINACVECLTNATCAGAKPICATATNTCRGCTGAVDCSAFVGRTACATTGACVQCTDNTTCSGTTPICATATNTCRKCSADSECSGVGPGVCMVDGHCATDAETVYVQNLAGTCADSGSGIGTAAKPYCTARVGVNVAASTVGKSVVVLAGNVADFSIAASSRTLAVVGKNAVITPSAATDGIDITSGTVYLRNLTVQGATSTGVGINGAPTSGNSVTLYVSGCKVMSNSGGGILLNGVAFDIENTSVTGNGPGTFGLANWGGVLVNNPPTGVPSTLGLVTIETNNGGGLTCSVSVTGNGVLSTGNTNTPTQISALCNVTSCASASTTCGAQ